MTDVKCDMRSPQWFLTMASPISVENATGGENSVCLDRGLQEISSRKLDSTDLQEVPILIAAHTLFVLGFSATFRSVRAPAIRSMLPAVGQQSQCNFACRTDVRKHLEPRSGLVPEAFSPLFIHAQTEIRNSSSRLAIDVCCGSSGHIAPYPRPKLRASKLMMLMYYRGYLGMTW